MIVKRIVAGSVVVILGIAVLGALNPFPLTTFGLLISVAALGSIVVIGIVVGTEEW